MKIVIVEDDKSIADVLKQNFKEHEVTLFHDGNLFLNYLNDEKNSAPDLCTVDWMLPGVSGTTLCTEMRKRKNWRTVPLLMITAKTDPTDIVSGLEAGADDYITKPFDLNILNARANALIRRNARLQTEVGSGTVITFNSIKMDISTREVLVDAEKVHLTPSEFNILASLIKNSGNVLTRKQLITHLLGEGIFVTDRVVDIHVFSLRKKLHMLPELIETIRGIGYRLN